MITRFGLIFTIGRERFNTFLTYFSPLALAGLLYTIIIIFAQQARHILDNIGPVFRVFVPMVMYFAIMFGLTFAWSWYWSRRRGLGRVGYEQGCVQSFTAASNNFVRPVSVNVVPRLTRATGTVYRGLRGGVWRKLGPSARGDDRPVGRGAGSPVPHMGVDIPRQAA